MAAVQIRIQAFSKGMVIGEKVYDPPEHVAKTLEGKTEDQIREICRGMAREFNEALKRSLEDEGVDTSEEFEFRFLVENE